MNSSGKRIPAGWSFMGGTLLGALAVVGLTGSIRVAGARAGEAGGQRTAVAASMAREASHAPAPAAPRADAGQQGQKLAGHPELELQVD